MEIWEDKGIWCLKELKIFKYLTPEQPRDSTWSHKNCGFEKNAPFFTSASFLASGCLSIISQSSDLEGNGHATL